MATSPLSVLTTEAAGGEKPPVVLLHGFASSGAADFVDTGWPESLGETGRTSYVIDLPGHGDSPAVESIDDGNTTRVVDALAEAIESTGAEQVDVVAYSLGARLAWELPARLPGRIRRLVLGGISPFEPFATINVDELRRAVKSDGLGAPADPMTGVIAGMIESSGRDTDSLVNLVGGLGSEPFAPDAGAPAVPTLFLAGTEDPMSQGIEGLVAAVDGATLSRVAGDHRQALDSVEFREAAIAFLDA